MSEQVKATKTETTMDDLAQIRAEFPTLNRLVNLASYDGLAVQAEAWEAFTALASARDELEAARTELRQVREERDYAANANIDWQIRGRVCQELITALLGAIKEQKDNVVHVHATHFGTTRLKMQRLLDNWNDGRYQP